MLVPFDAEKWLKSQNKQEIEDLYKPKNIHQAKSPNRSKNAYSQARTWIATIPGAIQGQKGSPHTFGVCCSLIKGFCLTEPEALSLIKEWNSACLPPWSEHELEDKIRSASQSPDQRPRGWMIEKTKSQFANLDNIDETTDPIPAEPDQAKHSWMLNDPNSLAVRFVKDNTIEENLCSYVYWNGLFYKWNQSYWQMLLRHEIDSYIWFFVESIYFKAWQEEMAEVPDIEAKGNVKKRNVHKSLIENIKIPLIGLISLPAHDQSEPFWIKEPIKKNWDAQDIIPVKNRIIHVPSFISNQSSSFLGKTPKYFCTYSLDYPFNYTNYDGAVEPSLEWDKFLRSVWDDDQEAIDCLQEWFGYLLTPCTKFQKLLMLIGPKRSGKGTILRVIKHMLGKRNIAYPTFSNIVKDFGKQTLIGKTAAVFPDARLSGRTDSHIVVETILSISGEDDQTITRKYLTDYTGQLSCRFIISSNELPRLPDNSTALVERAIILPFTKTFAGEEDINLEEKLLKEIPHILRWSIDGWKRLNEREHFVQPPSGQEPLNEFRSLSSAMSHFVDDVLEESQNYSTNTDTLFHQWKDWCDYQGRETAGDRDKFLRDLRAYVPKIKYGNPGSSPDASVSQWARPVFGLRIKPTLYLSTNGNVHAHSNGTANFDYTDIKEN